jgi:hypothetical protein
VLVEISTTENISIIIQVSIPLRTIACPLWRAIRIAVDIQTQATVDHTFGNWSSMVPKQLRSAVLVGADAAYRAIWLSRNDVTSNRKVIKHPNQILFRRLYWLQQWRPQK